MNWHTTNIGGKLFTNHIKEILSNRHLNTIIHVVNRVKKDSSFLSENFFSIMELATANLKEDTIVNNYHHILLDFSTIKRGYLTDIVTD